MSTMEIQRLRLDQVRQFRSPYEIDGLSPGLNILTGPNEAGKSTLVRAIRAAFFERHRSTSVDDLKPWGDASASPEIELDFTINGKPYKLTKRFFGRKRCNLIQGHQAFDGEEAEDLLAQTLGFTFAGRGASRPEHWGIPGLLWVEQGTGQELDVSHAREHLSQALSLQEETSTPALGDLTASRGDALLARMESLRAELLTQAGKPRGRLDEAIQLEDGLEAQLQELDSQISTYQSQVDELDRLRSQEQQEERDRPWEKLATDLSKSKASLDELKQMQQVIDADDAKLQILLQNRTLLLDQIAAYEEQDEKVDACQKRMAHGQEVFDAESAVFETAQSQHQQAVENLRQARATLTVARQEATRQNLLKQRSLMLQQAKQYQASLEGAEQAQTRIDSDRIAAEAIRISKKDVDKLAKLEVSLREAELRLQVLATRVDFALEGEVQVHITGDTVDDVLEGEGAIQLDAPTRFELPGIGVLTITPGGEDLVNLVAEVEDAGQKLQAGLQMHGLVTVGDGYERLQQFEALNQQLKLAQSELAIHAPNGVQALRDLTQEAQSALERLDAVIEQLPPPAEEDVVDLKEAERQVQTATQMEETAQEAYRDAERSLTLAKTRLEHATQEFQALDSLRKDPTRLAQRQQCSAQLLALQAEIKTLEIQLKESQAHLRLANPEIVEQDILRLSRSIDQMQSSRQDRRDRILLLVNTLEIAGAQGLEERRALTLAELELSRRRVLELRRRATALDWLCDLIGQRRQEAVMRLQAPLVQKMERYLSLLFPGSSIEIGEDLAPSRLQRRAGKGLSTDTLQTLSFGAREQLGLISRLAYADLLAEADKPTMIILDDALVHSDEGRLAQMKRVLFDAAQRHQILLFTCHPSLWRDMGVEHRVL